MFAKTVKFENLKESPEKDIIRQIEHFIYCLENNGQILSEHILVRNGNGFSLYATTPKSNSLDTCFDSIYVKKAREKLSKFLTVTVVQAGTNVRSQEYCSCKTRTAIEMQTFFGDIDSVFTCCTCGKPIALYELPYLNMQDDHWCIVNWQNTYRSTDNLWLDSLSDRFTGNQLVNVNSALNKRGREIADKMSRKTATKVYYNIFDDLTGKVKFTKTDRKTVRICPCCGNAMKYVKFCDDYERHVCEDCSLTSDLLKED